jgi:hypothetical protein
MKAPILTEARKTSDIGIALTLAIEEKRVENESEDAHTANTFVLSANCRAPDVFQPGISWHTN